MPCPICLAVTGSCYHPGTKLVLRFIQLVEGGVGGQQWPLALRVRDREGELSFGGPDGDPGQKARSCSLGGLAAVAEELVDDGWVSHGRCVPQVMVILSDLPKHPPHDFP